MKKGDVTILLFLLFFASACKQPPKNKPAEPDPQKIAFNYKKVRQLKPLLQSGDMVFRNGMDEVSQAARSFNRKDTSFSHCGIILLENDTAFVYHALGGSYNPSQKLMRQPIDSFCNPVENNEIGLYRYPLSLAQLQKLKAIVKNYYQAGLQFDLFFNFMSDDKMYCAEFVFKSLNSAVDSSLSSYVRMDTIPFGVTTDDLFLHPRTKLVRREKFIY